MIRSGCLLAFSALLFALPGRRQDDSRVGFRFVTIPVPGHRQATLAYDFDGDGRADILNTSIDQSIEPPGRWAFIHYQRGDGTFPERPDRIIQIDDRACALAFGNFEGDEAVEVAFLAPDGVYFYPSPGRTRIQRKPQKLLHLPTFFPRASLEEIPVWQYVLDLDGNGRDDLIVPAEEGYRIFFQTAPGVFGRVCRLEEDETAAWRRASRVVSFAEVRTDRATTFAFEKRMPRIMTEDINGDHRRDLLLVSGDRLTLFLMNKEGTYDRRSKQTRIVQTLSPPDKPGAIEVSGIWFQDLDHDGFPELIVTKIEGELGLIESLQTNVYIHRGNGTAAFTPDHTVAIPGLSINPTFLDLNGDSRADLYATFITTGVIRKALDAKVFGDMEVTTAFWRQSRDGKFTEPDDEHRMLVKTADVEQGAVSSFPIVHVGPDVSGDGRPDMIVITPAPALLVHRGRRRPRREDEISFEPRATREYPLQFFPRSLVFKDLNRDGIADLLLLHHHRIALALSSR